LRKEAPVQLVILKASDADLLAAEIQAWLAAGPRVVVALSVVTNPVESGLVAYIVHS
jgi:hypothetical protein